MSENIKIKRRYLKSETKNEARKVFNKIISEIATSQNISIREVSDILQYTYGFIVSKIREGKGEGIRIPYWGAFAVKPKNRIKLENYNKVNFSNNQNTQNTPDEKSRT